MGFTSLNSGGGAGSSGPVPTPIYRFLDINGNGTGTKNATGDYSSSEEIFYIQPAADEVFRIDRLIIWLRGEEGEIKWDWYIEEDPLTIGIEVRVQDNSSTLVDLTNGVPIKTVQDLMRVCFDVEIVPKDATDDYQAAAAKWTFSKAGYPLRLVGANNERLEVVLNDDFNSLDEHYFMVQGYIED